MSNPNSQSHASKVDAILNGVRVLPVVVIDDPDHALPLADALAEGGVRAMEITLRTPKALEAATKIVRERPDMIVGTGTILTPDDLKRSQDSGATFFVSPGLTPKLAQATADSPGGIAPLLPGTATVSDVMVAMEFGFERLKFFPAEAIGGVPLLKSIAGPIQTPKFCPTGGITAQTADKFLSLPNVFCIGGSWLTPKQKMIDGDWAAITELAREASKL